MLGAADYPVKPLNLCKVYCIYEMMYGSASPPNIKCGFR